MYLLAVPSVTLASEPQEWKIAPRIEWRDLQTRMLAAGSRWSGKQLVPDGANDTLDPRRASLLLFICNPSSSFQSPNCQALRAGWLLFRWSGVREDRGIHRLFRKYRDRSQDTAGQVRMRHRRRSHWERFFACGYVHCHLWETHRLLALWYMSGVEKSTDIVVGMLILVSRFPFPCSCHNAMSVFADTYCLKLIAEKCDMT